MNAAELLTSVRSLVAYQRTCGVDHYGGGEGVEAALRLLEKRARMRPPREGGARSSISPPPPETEARTETITIEGLAREIQACRNCSLHQTRRISTAGRGGRRPLLLVAGQWLVHDPDPAADAIFGDQQEVMLERMIAALGLAPEEVFVTNLIKCSVAASCTPEAGQIDACLSYLKRQIDILAPKAICAMGPAAAQALLATTQPLIRLRGRIHLYRRPDGGTIPLMPTFHPSYLLNNPEMKQSTWADLQTVGKRLGQRR